MAIAKVIYKSSAEATPEVWIDTTQKTVTAGSMLSGITALKNDGTNITGNISTKTSSNMTASGATVTAPAGYYASDASKSVASGTAGTPTASKGTVSNHSISVTPSVTNITGYITGSTKTGTAVTVNVTELESGTKSITANGTGISVSGYSAVDVAVELDCPIFTVIFDMDDISSVTCNKTYSECYTYYDSDHGEDAIVRITTDGENFYTEGASCVYERNYLTYYIANPYSKIAWLEIAYSSNGTITATEIQISEKYSEDLVVSGATVTAPAGVYFESASATVASGTEGTPVATKGTVSNHSINVTPSVTNTAGYISGGTKTGTAVTVSASELVSGTLSINSSGTKDVTNYASASIDAGSATTPATTITANPTISVNSSTGLITATASVSTSVVPTVSQGYVSSGTAGTITVSGSNTSQLSTQTAQTIHPSTSAQTISSGKYLTGTQTISAVTLSNLTAGNIKKDVVVKIGDSSDDDCVANVTGTYEGDSGADFPTFTINFDDNSGDILSITCNKTYAECLEYFDYDDDEMTNCAIIDVKYYDNNTLIYEMISGASAIPPASGATSIVYTMPSPYDGMIPGVVITYSSSGTITWSENPVARRDSTDLTANTLTVTAPAGYYASAASKTLIDANLVAANIKKNISIFGVTGSYEGDSAANIYQDENGYIVLDPGSAVTPAPEKWINFIDYDGTILYSYTKAEFAQLEALPSNPTHPNLVSQGWNWRLTDIQSELTNGGLSKIWVGQMYNTQSGKTEIDVEFVDPDYLSPYLVVGTYSYTTLTVDWGDGSTPYSSSNNNTSGTRHIQHTYSSVGKYTLKISAGESIYYFYNSYGSGHPSILYAEESSSNGNNTRNSVYANCIKAIRVSDNCYIHAGAFRTLYGLEYMTISNTIANVTNTSSYQLRYYAWMQDTSLKSLTIPYGVVKTTYNYNFFSGCTSLKNVSVPPTLDISAITECYSDCKNLVHPYYPSTWTSIPSKYFYGCVSLRDVTLPSSGLTTIEQNAFNGNNSLMEITIPATVTTIGNDAFRYNYYMIYHFLSATPPTLGNSTVFGSIADGCKIYVPSASVNAYKTATNWSTYASYIEAEPT